MEQKKELDRLLHEATLQMVKKHAKEADEKYSRGLASLFLTVKIRKIFGWLRGFVL